MSNEYLDFGYGNEFSLDEILESFTGKELEKEITLLRHRFNGKILVSSLNSRVFKRIIAIGNQLKKKKTFTYTLGLRGIRFRRSIQMQKAVYVSKPIAAPGLVKEVQLSSDEEHVEVDGFDTDRFSSVEYSVTNKVNPSKEEDWFPVLPLGTEAVIGERVFLDENGWGHLRFPAKENESIVVYRNGIKYDVTYPHDSEVGIIRRIKIPRQENTRASIFTIDYIPSGDVHRARPTIPANLYVIPAGKGHGESFTGVGPNRNIELEFIPYVDYSRVDSSVYNLTNGLDPYQPILVLVDGVPAINLTNYKGGDETSFSDQDLESDTVYYVQRDNILVFDKEISKPIKVFYSHLPVSFRVRAIARSNHPTDQIDPQVDWLQLACKVDKAFKKVIPGSISPDTIDPGDEGASGSSGATSSVIITGGDSQ